MIKSLSIHNNLNLFSLSFILLFAVSNANAQDYGCDKCSMLREEYEAAVSPKKEEIYAFFKQECLETDTVFVSDKGTVTPAESATVVKVVNKGKCIDYNAVKEFEKSSKKEIRSYNVVKTDTLYTVGTTVPSFPGGEAALINFLNENIHYPADSRVKNIQGTVYLKFVVSKDGLISQVKSVRSPAPDLTTEAIRVVKSMPKWHPGTFKKQDVSMVCTIPVKFRIKN